MDGGLEYCVRGGDQNHPQEKEMWKSKMAFSEEALKIAVKEEKWKAKEKRKNITIWMQSSKEEQGEIRKLLSDNANK